MKTLLYWYKYIPAAYFVKMFWKVQFLISTSPPLVTYIPPPIPVLRVSKLKLEK